MCCTAWPYTFQLLACGTLLLLSTDRRRDLILSKILSRLNGIEKTLREVVQNTSGGNSSTPGIRRLRHIQDLEELDECLSRSPQMRIALVRFTYKTSYEHWHSMFEHCFTVYLYSIFMQNGHCT